MVQLGAGSWSRRVQALMELSLDVLQVPRIGRDHSARHVVRLM